MRTDYVAGLDPRLQFDFPDPILNRTYAFAKIRAAKSIYKTKGGMMHGPRRSLLLCVNTGKAGHYVYFANLSSPSLFFKLSGPVFGKVFQFRLAGLQVIERP